MYILFSLDRERYVKSYVSIWEILDITSVYDIKNQIPVFSLQYILFQDFSRANIRPTLQGQLTNENKNAFKSWPSF